MNIFDLSGTSFENVRWTSTINFSDQLHKESSVTGHDQIGYRECNVKIGSHWPSFYLTWLRDEYNVLATIRPFCIGQHTFEMCNSGARRIYLVWVSWGGIVMYIYLQYNKVDIFEDVLIEVL